MAQDNPNDLGDLNYGYWELVKARPAYERAAAMYEGTVDEIYSSSKVTQLLTKFGLDSIESMNFAHIPVDAVANKLRLNAVTVEEQDLVVGPNPTSRRRLNTNATPPVSGGPVPDSVIDSPAPKPDNPVNAVIEDLFDYNEMSEELPILFRNTGKFGDYYMMVWPVLGEVAVSPSLSKGYDKRRTVVKLATGETPVEDNDVAVAPGTTSVVAVDMMMLDPLTTRVFYDVENPKKKKFAIRSWQEGTDTGIGGKQNVITRANLYYTDRIERWVCKGKPSQRANANSRNSWEPYTEDGEAAVLSNPFNEIPFFHFRTDRTYGVPDHKNAYGPQLAINKLVTSHLATIDYQSFPQRYALIDPVADQSGFQGADSDPFAPDDLNQFPEDEDNDSQLEADPASLWQFRGVKTVGQFEAATADAYLKPFDRYVKALAQVTDTPFHYFDRTGERPPSGENIRQINEQLNSKAAARQTSYGSELRKSVTFALNLLGHDVERVSIVWEPLENVTSLVEWQAIQAKQESGVPRPVTLVEAGYRKELVDQWEKEAEAKAAKEAADAQAAEHAKIQAAAQAKMDTTLANQGAKPQTPKPDDSATPKPPVPPK